MNNWDIDEEDPLNVRLDELEGEELNPRNRRQP
jgi:hypothetical protein